MQVPSILGVLRRFDSLISAMYNLSVVPGDGGDSYSFPQCDLWPQRNVSSSYWHIMYA